MSCILNDREMTLPRELMDRVQVHWFTGKMHRHNRLGLTRHLASGVVHIHVETARDGVYEYRPGAEIESGIGGGKKGHRGDENFIARTQACDGIGGMQRGCSGRH